MTTILKKDLTIPFRWEDRRHVFLDHFLYIPKKYDSKTKAEVIEWSGVNMFGNDFPVYVEFCSGNGEWIVDQAKAFPDRNWVAVEMRFARAKQIWLRATNEGLTNFYVVCGEAREFLSYYVQPNCFAKSFVNFPDPWPKRLHAKHRIIQAPFIALLKKTLEPNASVTLVTDNAPYRDQMIEEFSQWPSDFKAPFFCTDLPSYGQSFFAKLWIGKV